MERHPVDLVSLVAGSVVLGIGLLLISGGIASLKMEWVGPVVAIGLGVVIIFAARPNRESSDADPRASHEG
jgi:uncharacterized membrane protein